jgi:phosphocarrier protein HPr
LPPGRESADKGLARMTEQTLSRTVVVTHAAGLHLRPADLFVKRASEFDAKVEVIKDRQRVDGKSLLSILTLGVEQGSAITIEAVGQDAAAALDALARLIERGFCIDDTES